MKTERIYKFDNYKFFLICCVVLGHIGNKYAPQSRTLAMAQFWVYLFHMPAFIFVSGLFSKKTIDMKRWNKIVPYIFLYVVMEIIEYVASVMVRGVEQSGLDLFHENGVPWFALTMFWCFFITVFVRKVHPGYVLVVSILLSVISGYCANIGSFLVIQRTIIFYPFFYLGYIIEIDKLLEFTNKIIVKIISTIVIIGSLVWVAENYEKVAAWRSLFRARYTYMEMSAQYQWGFLWRLAAYGISFIMLIAIISIVPYRKLPISWLGQRTLSVFVLHYPLLVIMFNKWDWMMNWMPDGKVAVHALIVCFVVVLFTSLKPFDYLVRLIMNVPERKKADIQRS